MLVSTQMYAITKTFCYLGKKSPPVTNLKYWNSCHPSARRESPSRQSPCSRCFSWNMNHISPVTCIMLCQYPIPAGIVTLLEIPGHGDLKTGLVRSSGSPRGGHHGPCGCHSVKEGLCELLHRNVPHEAGRAKGHSAGGAGPDLNFVLITCNITAA